MRNEPLWSSWSALPFLPGLEVRDLLTVPFTANKVDQLPLTTRKDDTVGLRPVGFGVLYIELDQVSGGAHTPHRSQDLP